MGNLMKWYQMVTAQPHKATANGGSILIAEPKIERLAVTFAPVQSGSGTPSPTNVRPISGWSAIPVSIGSQTESISLGDTYYGGVVDLVSGVLTVDRAMVDLGTLNWNQAAIGTGYRFHSSFTAALANKMPKVPTDLSQKMGLICSMFDEKLPNQYNAAVNGITIYTNSTFQIYDASIRAMSTTEFKAAVSGVLLVYELATPQTYQLTPQTINALRGMQTISSSAGSVEVTYWTN